MLNWVKGEVPYLSEDASNLFTFINVAIIILYILYNQYPVDHKLYPFPNQPWDST